MNTNPRAIALCIGLFLSSVFVTYSVRSSHHNGSWLPSLHKGFTSHRSNQHAVAAPKIAFATFLAAPYDQDADAEEDDDPAKDNEDGYYLSTRVLGYQLLHSMTAGTNNSIPFVVMCTPAVSQRKRDRLEKDGATVVVVDMVETGKWANADEPRWRDVYAKLRVFQFTQYSKILFIDADHLVVKPLDGVFYDEATLTQATNTDLEQVRDDEGALPRTYMFAAGGDRGVGYDHPWPPAGNNMYMNCGFFTFTPSKVLFDYYMSLLKLPGRFPNQYAEQSMLNYAHRRNGNMPWKPLWYGWNVNWPTEQDWRGGARSFHAKYWDGDPSHDPFLKAIWKEQRAEMEGFYRGRDEAGH